MSEFLLELGSSPGQRSSLAGSELADSWLAANDFASRLGSVLDGMRGQHARRMGAFPDVNSLAEAWAEINRLSVGDSVEQIRRMASAYDVISSPSILDAVYQTLGARIRSGHYDDRDWEGYLDLADARLDMRGALVSPSGGDARIRMGEEPPGLSGGFIKRLTKKGGVVRKIGKVAKKVVPVAAAAVATYFTGGAAAPLLGAALSHAIGGKKKKAEQTPQQQASMTYTADMVANVETLEEAGVAVPPKVSEFAQTAAGVLSSSATGLQALDDSFRVIKSGIAAAGGDPALQAAVEAAEARAKSGMPDWFPYVAIGGAGLLGVGIVAMILLRPGRASSPAA